MGDAKTIVRNSLWTLLDNVIGMVSALGCSIAVARKMGPENLGYFNYVVWLATMASWVAAFGIPGATRRYAAEYIGRGEYGIARAIVRVTFRLQMWLALATVAAGTVFVAIVVPREHRLYAALAVASILPYLLYSVPSSAIAATEDLLPNVRASVITTVINAVGVALTLILDWGLPGLAAAMFVQRAVDWALRHYYYKRIYNAFPTTGEDKLPPELRQRIIRFCWQATLLTAVQVAVWERSEMVFLQHYSGIVQVAFFSLGFNISQHLLLLPRVASTAAASTISVQQGRDPRGTAALAVGTTRVLALLCTPVAFGLAATSGPLLTLMYGQEYLPAIPVLALMAVFTLGKALQLPARQLLMATEHQGTLMVWEFGLVLPNLALDFWLIPTHGAVGGAIAKGIIQVVAAVSVWAIVWRKFGAALPLGRMARMLAAAVVMFVVVRAAGAGMKPLLALVVGIPLGVVAIVVCFRLFGCLEETDRPSLAAIQRRLPGPLRNGFASLVAFVVPAAPGSPSVSPP